MASYHKLPAAVNARLRLWQHIIYLQPVCLRATLCSMKALLLNGSPNAAGNTYHALSIVAEAMNAAGVETEIVQIGAAAVQGCIGCRQCLKTGRCGMKDKLYSYIYDQLDSIDGIVIGSPTYFAGPNGSLCALLDRLYYSAGAKLAYKPGATVAVARRCGASTTLDRLNKYITYNNQPLVSSFYWNMIYGMRPGEVQQDAEGAQTLCHLGQNMAWVMQCLAAGPKHPQAPSPRAWTHFIR